jgi:hypothetical protein
MAVSLESEPFELTTVKPDVTWEITMDTPSNATIRRFAFYELVKVSGGIGANGTIGERQVVPYTSQTIRVDFSDTIRRLLGDQLPALDDDSTLSDSEMWGEFSIRFGELQQTISTGAVVEFGVTVTTARKVFRSAFQHYEYDWVTEPGPLSIFSNKPETLRLGLGQSDWIYLYVKTALGGVVTRFYNALGAEIGAAGALYTSGTAVGYPIGPGNNAAATAAGITDWTQVYYYTIELGTFSGGDVPSPDRTFRIYVDNCEPTREEVDLFWLEPAGGYASLRFKTVQFGVNRSTTRFREWGIPRTAFGDPTGGIQVRSTTGGFEIGQANVGEEMILTVELDQLAYSRRRYHTSIFASREHWIRTTDSRGNIIAVKFLVDDGSFSVADAQGKTTFTVQGRIFKDLQTM